MDQVIMVACDLHDRTMLLKIAVAANSVVKTLTLPNTCSGRGRLIALLKSQAAEVSAARVVFAYEASGQGFGLCDQLTDAGIQCHVLAPTRIARSCKHQRQKTDEKDAQVILELLRGHVLAGNELPTVWIPDAQTRDDREIVRARLDLAEKITATKTQIQPCSSVSSWFARQKQAKAGRGDLSLGCSRSPKARRFGWAWPQHSRRCCGNSTSWRRKWPGSNATN
jgi:transposase